MRLTLRSLYLTMCGLIFMSVTAFSQTATISTDQADYPPGSTVIISGSGFQAGEPVTLQVLHYPTEGDDAISPDHQPWTVSADANGNVSSSWYIPDDQDELGAISWFEGGEVFRSGCTWRRGKGKVVYFSPGHETFPIYHNPNVQRIIANAVWWAAPSGGLYLGKGRNIKQPLSPIAAEHVVDESLHRAK